MEKKPPVGVIIGVVGGALLFIGSMLTWATVSLDVPKFAQLLGLDPSTLQGLSAQSSKSVAGTSADGKYTLIAGIIVIAGVLVAYVRKMRAGAVLAAVAGAGGVLIALIEFGTKDSQIDRGLEGASSQLAQIGISAAQFKTVVNVSWGIGLYVVIVGGVIAIVGAVLTMQGASAAPSMPMATSTLGMTEPSSTAPPTMAPPSTMMPPPAAPAPPPNDPGTGPPAS